MSELESLARVWILALAALVYIYAVVGRLPKNTLRLIAMLPVSCMFLNLPWLLSSIVLRSINGFFLIWLCNFRLLLFCFDTGPLIHYRRSLPHFLAFAALPINAKPPSSSHQPHPSTNLITTLLNLVIESVIILLSFLVYIHREKLPHPSTLLLVYGIQMLASMDIIFVCTAVPARLLLGVELEPQFNRPFLSTSLGNFWGHRWNLVVTRTLRMAVYLPVRSACSTVMGNRLARAVAKMVTFMVSGLMHELILYYLTMQPPTWEWTGFFFLHGFLVVGEDYLEWVLGPKLVGRLPNAIKVLLTLTVLFATGIWLAFPPMIRNGHDRNIATEIEAALKFLAHHLIGMAAN